MIEEQYLKKINITRYENCPTVSILQSYTNDWNVAHKMLVSSGFLNGDDYSITEHGLTYLSEKCGDNSYIFDYYIVEMMINHIRIFLYGKEKYDISNTKYIHHSLIDSNSIFGINNGSMIRYNFN
jgi:hypothetical protein